MSPLGREIHREYDQYGAVRVFEDGQRRILSLGGEEEQSCALKGDVTQLQHEYTRAMLLVLLFVEPRRVLSLGLGAGCINSCLHHRFPRLQQQVVELRPAVIEAARRFFQLPSGKRLQVAQMDAGAWLAAPVTERVDLILSDLYGPQGMEGQQVDPVFLERCAERLKPGGWLVLNCWRDDEDPELINRLSIWFSDIRTTLTQDGNWILFAGRSSVELGSAQLKRNLKALEQQLGFSLQPAYKRLRRMV